MAWERLDHRLTDLLFPEDENRTLGLRFTKQWLGQFGLWSGFDSIEARLRQAEQKFLPSPAASPEYAKQQEAQASEEETALPRTELTTADERQEQLRVIAGEVIYWKGGLNVLRQA